MILRVRKIIIILLCVLVFFVQSGQGKVLEETSWDLIETAFSQGKISINQKYVFKLQTIFTPSFLPSEYQGGKIDGKNLTLLLVEIRQNWNMLDNKTKKILFPFLLRPTNPSYPVDLNGDGKPDIDLAYKVSEAPPYDTPQGNFRIHYVISTVDAPDLTDISPSDGVPDYVNLVGDVFEYCYQKEVYNMHYSTPPPDGTEGGNSRYDVYISSIHGIGYGITFPETKIASRPDLYTSFILVDNNYSTLEFGTRHTPTEFLQVTAAHEYFHAIQFGIDVDEDAWWMEATAVWMEDEVYNSVNDYAQYYDVWFSSPKVSLNFEDGWHEYGSSVFAKYLSEKYGGPGIIQTIWNNCKTKDSLDAIATALGDPGKFDGKFQTAFSSFVLTNYYKIPPDGYIEGSSYPVVHIEDFSVKASQNEHVFQVGTRGNEAFPDENIPELDHLSSQYIKFIQPKLIDKPTKLHIDFTAKGVVWATRIIKVLNDGQKVAGYLPSDGIIDNFGIDKTNPQSNQIKEIIFVPVNNSKSGDIKPYSVVANVVPQFRVIYDTTPANGTTETVKNLDSDNTYWNDETIHLEVTLSYQIKEIQANLSNIDKNFDPTKVKYFMEPYISTAGVKCRIEYAISSGNYFIGSGNIEIKAIDLNGREQIDNSFSLKIESPWSYIYCSASGLLLEQAGWYRDVMQYKSFTENINREGLLYIKYADAYGRFRLDDTRLKTLPITLEFKLKQSSMKNQGQLESENIFGIYGAFLYINNDRIILFAVPNNYTYYMNTTDILHIYRMTVDEVGKIRVYVDNNPNAVIQSDIPFTLSNPEMTCLRFNGGVGEMYLEYIAFKEGGAYPPGTFPETSSVGILVSKFVPDATFKSGEVYSYPNPAKNGKTSKIHIECGIADKVDFDIYDTAGQMIHSTEMIGMPNVIWENKYAYEYAWDISNIASGVYVYIVKALKEGEKEIKAIGKIGIIK